VLVPRLTDLVLAEIYDAIEVEANRHGLDSFVVNTHDETREQLRRVRSLVARRVNGLILGDVYRVGTSLAAIEAFNVPFVLVNRSRRGYPSSTCDDQLGGHLVGSHLANMGHTEIGIISGGLHTSTAYDRVDGCRRALAERGIDIPESRIIALGFDVEAGRRGAAALLDSRNPPTAIFATNDFAAIGAMGVLRDKHLQAGRDVAVVGFNDISLCRDLAIPLTSVRSPHALIGRTAVDMLLKLLAGDECQSILHAPELIVRESSDPGTSTYSDGYGGDHKAPHDAPSK
jgi:LacI family transcriptional regulator